jgi:hypothetical protein
MHMKFWSENLTATEYLQKKNKFWEELIAYFPWYDTGHIENDASNNSSIAECVFVTAVKFLPRRGLATTGGKHRHTQEATWSHEPTLFYQNKKFWEELIAYFPWYDTGHIENDASKNSSIVACVFVAAVTFLPSRGLATTGGETQTHTQTATWSHKPTLFFQNKECRLNRIIKDRV